MKHRVYLAGPITGCTYKCCTDWREYVKNLLDSDHTVCLSPMRAKKFWADEEIVENSGLTAPMATNRGIMCRDRNDCTNASVLLVNFREAVQPSIGTIMEVAWANLCRIPIVAVLPHANAYDPHNHGMMFEAYDFTVRSMDEAVKIVRTIIGEDE